MKMFKKKTDYSKLKELKGSIIIVEGIIGAGKSTFCKRLATYLEQNELKVKYFPEYVNHKLLSLYLKDRKKYAVMFQYLVLMRRQDIYRQAYELSRNQNYVCIVDRSIYGDLAFAKLNLNFFSKEEWDVYESIRHGETETGTEVYIEPDHKIYLDVTIDTAIKRITMRDRISEKDSYDFSYLHDLLREYKNVFKDVDITVIDNNSHLTDDAIANSIDLLFKEKE